MIDASTLPTTSLPTATWSSSDSSTDRAASNVRHCLCVLSAHGPASPAIRPDFSVSGDTADPLSFSSTSPHGLPNTVFFCFLSHIAGCCFHVFSAVCPLFSLVGCPERSITSLLLSHYASLLSSLSAPGVN